jgi:hypothetical protein
MFRRLHLGVVVPIPAIALLIASLVALPAAPAAASGSADLECTISATLHIHPGEIVGSLRPQVATTEGPTGTADCTGTIDGEPVTSTATYNAAAHYLGNCVDDSGSGIFVLNFPPSVGKTVVGTYAFTLTGFTGDITGSVTTISSEGDCVTTPLTSDTLVGDVHITT